MRDVMWLLPVQHAAASFWLRPLARMQSDNKLTGGLPAQYSTLKNLEYVTLVGYACWLCCHQMGVQV